jgi:hypothetical protein
LALGEGRIRKHERDYSISSCNPSRLAAYYTAEKG